MSGHLAHVLGPAVCATALILITAAAIAAQCWLTRQASRGRHSGGTR